MRLLSIICGIFLPNMAFAHIGHIDELAGHGHLIGLGAFGIALGIILIIGIRKAQKNKGKKSNPENQRA